MLHIDQSYYPRSNENNKSRESFQSQLIQLVQRNIQSSHIVPPRNVRTLSDYQDLISFHR